MPTELTQRVEIALAQSKKVEREARQLKQMLGGLQDDLKQHLQPLEVAQGEDNGSNTTQRP